jgi:hypothetical protein
MAEFNHGGGFVEILAGKALGRSFPKRLLRRAQNVARIRPAISRSAKSMRDRPIRRNS